MEGIGTRNYRWPSLRVVGVYFVVSSSWIFFSDRLLASFVEPSQITVLQTAKGWGFVVFTSILLYVLIARVLVASRSIDADMAGRQKRLDLILSQIPGNLWTVDRDLRFLSLEGNGPVDLARDAEQDLIGTTLYDRLGSTDVELPPLRAHLEALRGQRSGYMIDWEGRTIDAVVTPLRSRGEVVGAIGFSLDVTDRVTLERERIASFARLQRADEQRVRLLRHLVRAQEVERDRLASGLHDHTIQIVTSVGMGLDLLLESLPAGQEADLLKRTREHVTTALRGLRSLVFDLKLMDLERHGLESAVANLLDTKGKEGGFDFTFSADVNSFVPQETALIVYRLIQEAVTNVVKHANASNMSVALSEHQGGLEVEIADDGQGFDPSAPRRPKHFGLSDMEDRAAVVDGWCRVDSAPGKGTKVRMWVPIGTIESGGVHELSA